MTQGNLRGGGESGRVGARRSREGLVLVCDADAKMRHYVRGLLDEHFEVVAASDAADALQEMQRAQPHLVVTDGLALMRAARADPHLHHVPFMLLLDQGGDEAVLDALAQGADDCLAKPFGAKQLVARVEAFVAMARARHRRVRGALEASLEETHRLKSRYAADLHAMYRLNALAMRLLRSNSVDEVLDEVLGAVIALQRADFGCVQLHDRASHELCMAAQRGVDKAFLQRLEASNALESSASALALAAGRRVAIDDVRTDPRFAAHLAYAQQDGYRAVQATPLMGSQGQLLGMLSTYFRERRHLDERDLRLTDLYVGAAAAFIERKLEEASLRDADRRKDEMLATIAHELRSPIVPLAAALESARMRYAGDAWLMRTVAMMDRQLGQLARLVDDLMDIGRIKAGKVRLHRVRIPLARVIDDALEECRPAIEARRHHLVVEPGDGALAVEVDPHRMSQVVCNILQNAVKYTPKGGRIVLSTWREGATAAISVADNGAGIPASDLPRVFELFSQGSAQQGHRRSGLGIGLSIVRSLVELHGGNVTAESAGPGEGSRFTVRLPVSDAPSAPHPRERLAGLRVLVADDNADAADAVAALLRGHGFDVAIAHDGIEALERAAESRPDAVLLDIGMPRMDGFEAARRLRESHGKAVCIVALTGWGEDKDRERTRAAGFDAHLVKPVTFDSLKEVLARVRSEALGRHGIA